MSATGGKADVVFWGCPLFAVAIGGKADIPQQLLRDILKLNSFLVCGPMPVPGCALLTTGKEGFLGPTYFRHTCLRAQSPPAVQCTPRGRRCPTWQRYEICL